MAQLGVFTQLDSIGPEDISIDPALARNYNTRLVANVDRGEAWGPEAFTDYVKDNKIWIIVAFVVILALIFLFMRNR